MRRAAQMICPAESTRNPIRPRQTRLARLGALLLTALAACTDGAATGPARVPVAAVQVAPDTHVLDIGQTVRLTARALAADGAELQGRSVTWTSESEATAVVDATGLVTARVRGTARIVATSEGRSGAVQITVRGPDDPPAPTPVLQSLAPTQIQAGWSTFTLRLTGENFTADSRVRWGGETRQVEFVSATELRLTVHASDVMLPKEVAVAVETPGAGGGASAPVTFRVFPVAVASVTVSSPAGSPWTWTGLSLPLQATARDAAGRELTGREVAWSSDDASIARVGLTGIVRGVSPGRTTVTATVGGVAGSTSVTVHAAPAADLVFDARVGDGRQLLVWSPGTGAAPRLLPLAMSAYDPSPSPDGSRIAFTGVDASGNADIWVVNRNGSGLTRLTTHTGMDDQPAWSPDGRSIAFRSTRGGRADIWLVDVTTGEARQLTGAPGSGEDPSVWIAHAWPAWSPDGQHLVYSASPSVGADLWIMRADGSDKRQLTSGREIDLDPTWSPDGAVITFRREFGSVVQMVSVFAATGQPVIQTIPPGAGWGPAYSPDGRWLTYATPQAGGQPVLTAMPADGGHGPRRLSERGIDVEGHNAAWMRRR